MKKLIDHRLPKNILILLIFSVISLMRCGYKQVNSRFDLLTGEMTNIDFENTITETDSVNMIEFSNIYNGAGVGVGDFNLDGKPDVFFSGNMVSSRLYLNKSENGHIHFEDVSKKSNIHTSRWATGVSVADVNADGLLDIYVCVSGNKSAEKRKNYLFINQGMGDGDIPVFKEMAEEYGVADDTYSTQAAFFDFDLDGDLDLFVAVNLPENFYGSSMNKLTPVQTTYSDRTDRLYENKGPGPNGHNLFKDVSRKTGLMYEGYTLGLVVQDLNEDGWPDIYLSNDFLSNDIVYVNKQDGTFSNEIGSYFKHTTFAGMGCDIADYNNDALPDIAVLDMIPSDNEGQKRISKATSYDIYHIRKKLGYYPQFNRNTLQLNNGLKPDGTPSFSEIGQLANMNYSDWSWSVLFGDLNNNGWKDMLITNGFKRDMQDLDLLNDLFNGFNMNDKQALNNLNEKLLLAPEVFVENRFFENQKDLTFRQATDWGIHEKSFSSGAVLVDIDNDGDLDAIISNINDQPHIYRNNTIAGKVRDPESNWLKLRFSKEKGHKSLLGTKVYINHGNGIQYLQYFPLHGYLSSVDDALHFGLGTDTIVHSIKVVLPDQQAYEAFNLPGNQSYSLEDIMRAKVGVQDISRQHNTKLFTEVTQPDDNSFFHKEIDFNDFAKQPLLLRKYSQQGPSLAVGDVNGDHLDDFFVGGAIDQNGAIFIQTKAGGFTKSTEINSEDFEDMGALLFDADRDGDNDLYLVAGGVEYGSLRDKYRDRLYFNDGKGNFTVDNEAIPEILTSGFCVNATDLDRDGDLDLFVGGGVDIRNYPKASPSYLLMNESQGNKIVFKDKTAEWAPELANVGLVTSSLWTDFNNDGKIDLMLVGEWMPVTFFENTGERLINVTASKYNFVSNGWWGSINGADFDRDGDIDYIVGNFGLNSKYRASKEEPITLYSSDFDNNGKIDPLVFQYIDGKNVPVHTRDLIVSQLPAWELKFHTFKDFALTGFKDFQLELSDKDINKLSVNELQSIYFENLGDGKFSTKPLDIRIQMAPITGININDYNDDGFLDIICSGNFYASDYGSGPIDAYIGSTLLGNGDGTFNYVTGLASGLFIDNDAKALVTLLGIDNRYIISAANNDQITIFKNRKCQGSMLELNNDEWYATIRHHDGRIEKREFYHTSGYLSSSSRTIEVPATAKEIAIYNYNNQKSRNLGF